ncbi:uncharacterized protein LOC132819006 [Hemiscyllium ocellatum]|uniref:uncharacterized protein LOC132819006 n=1 Tax=Hemiscyllium ocellatum TaxID=170820 RepID=UPI002965E881|nr:uncharacterized protein LOC132819006 [Hemiscyllium ocellatum]
MKSEIALGKVKDIYLKKSEIILVIFIFLKDCTMSTATPITQSLNNGSAVNVPAIVIPVLLIPAIIGLIVWGYIHFRSKGFYIPNVLMRSRRSDSGLDERQLDNQQEHIYNSKITNHSAERVSSSNTSPKYEANHALYHAQPNYENVMIDPNNQPENSEFTSAADHQQIQISPTVDYNETIYENSSSLDISPVYCNYTGPPNDENDDTYIIPSE